MKHSRTASGAHAKVVPVDVAGTSSTSDVMSIDEDDSSRGDLAADSRRSFPSESTLSSAQPYSSKMTMHVAGSVRHSNHRSNHGRDHAEPHSTLQRFRLALWKLMDDPSSSRAAQFIAITVMLAISLSTISFVLQTLPQFVNDTSGAWDIIEVFCVVLFTTEFMLRLLSCPNLRAFVQSPLNWVDALAILPFYAELVFGTSTSGRSVIFRVIRLVRIFRVFKISRYVTWIKTFVSAMMLSAWPLGMLLFVMVIGCVVFSSLMYYAERGSWDPLQAAYVRPNGARSPFQSVPETFYWCIITMCTVGYGDVVPITSWGRLIAAVTSIMGVMVLAVPITVISTNFSQEFNKLKKHRETMRARMLLLKSLNSSRRSGLEAMHEEIEDLSKRNTDEMRGTVEAVLDSFRDDLCDELKEVTRIAYKERKLLPLVVTKKPSGLTEAITAGLRTDAHATGAATRRKGSSAIGSKVTVNSVGTGIGIGTLLSERLPGPEQPVVAVGSADDGSEKDAVIAPAPSSAYPASRRHSSTSGPPGRTTSPSATAPSVVAVPLPPSTRSPLPGPSKFFPTEANTDTQTLTNHQRNREAHLYSSIE